MMIKLKGLVRYKTYGVGKHRTYAVYLELKGHPSILLPKKAKKEFFYRLAYGYDHDILPVEVIIT